MDNKATVIMASVIGAILLTTTVAMKIYEPLKAKRVSVR